MLFIYLFSWAVQGKFCTLLPQGCRVGDKGSAGIVEEQRVVLHTPAVYILTVGGMAILVEANRLEGEESAMAKNLPALVSCSGSAISTTWTKSVSRSSS